MTTTNKKRKRRRRRKRRKTLSDLISSIRSLTIQRELNQKRKQIGQEDHLNTLDASSASALLARACTSSFSLINAQSNSRHWKGSHHYFAKLTKVVSPSCALNHPIRSLKLRCNRNWNRSQSSLWICLILHTILACSVGDAFEGVDQVRAANLSTPINSDESRPQSIGGQEIGGQVLVQTTKQGIFKGVLMSDLKNNAPNQAGDAANVAAFLGIRYASAPIRRLRFMPPTPFHYAPNQVHNAQLFGPICRQRFPVDLANALANWRQSPRDHQVSIDMNSQLFESQNENWSSQMRLTKSLIPKGVYLELRDLLKRLAAFEQSEDCLNLNVYSPIEAISGSAGQAERPKAAPFPLPLPVLVMIHGESFDYGSGSIINGFNFVKQSRLIVVTFNYRLNILGFPPKLAGASRGNLGLMDQVAALHWIRENIGSFGGSPNNITLMGTKKGAIFVNLLMMSPLAKGLFQRAVMEDGSALTPLVANHIVSSSGYHQQTMNRPNSPASLSFGQQPAVQHVRLLARLCDCPIYQPALQVQNKSSAPKLGLLSSLADETKSNALTFECLRHKPVESILQHVPLNLLQLDQLQLDAKPLIRTRWLGKSLMGNIGELPDQVTASKEESSSNNLRPLGQTDSMFAPINAHQLAGLIIQAAKKELSMGGPQIGPISGEQSAANSSPSPADKDHQEEVDEELFGAIYGQPSSSVKPLFAPIIDGTILPDEDVSAAMLKPNSIFAQRDLLIGFSRSIFRQVASNYRDDDEKEALDEGRENWEEKEEEFGVKDQLRGGLDLGPGLYLNDLLVERISEQMELFGLTNEQAIELVNTFVKSFYRYHNQEITNSIINHYLSNNEGNANNRRLLRRRMRKLMRQINASKRDKTKSLALNQFPGKRDDLVSKYLGNETDYKLIEQQLIVLDSLLEAFQDALTNVPLLRTALIHATRQLDSLVEVFIGQQFERWRQRHSINKTQSYLSSSQTTNNLDQQSLFDSFTLFAQTLFNDPNWPLELHSSSSNNQAKSGQDEDDNHHHHHHQPDDRQILLQPKATYLYQLIDSAALAKEVHKLSDNLLGFGDNYSTWKLVKQLLTKLEHNLRDSNVWNKFSFGCAFYHSHSSDELANNTNHEVDDDPVNLGLKFRAWICSRLSSILANFVASGNVNIDYRTSEMMTTTPIANQEPIGDLIARFESKCRETKLTVSSSGADEANQLSDTCREDLISIALHYLTQKWDFRAKESLSPSELATSKHWTVFNLFSQRIATLPGLQNSWQSIEQIWGENGNVNSNYVGDSSKSTFAARSSFWANFVPALNCSKTQPINIPTSLLSSSGSIGGSSNSSMLHLNLHFTCQQGQQRTAFDSMKSITNSIKQQLESRINDWKVKNQNHHSLRMANMSQSNGSDEQSNVEQQETASELEQAKGGYANSINAGSGETKKVTVLDPTFQDASRAFDARAKFVGVVLIVCGLAISVTIVAGACSVICQRGEKVSGAVIASAAITLADSSANQRQPIGLANVHLQCESDLDEQLNSAVFVGAKSDPIEPIATRPDQAKGDHFECTYLSQQPNSFARSSSIKNHVCALDTNQQQEQQFAGGSLIYWNPNGTATNQQIVHANATLCRSHSNLSNLVALNGEQMFAAMSQSSASEQQLLIGANEEQPIMMPILGQQCAPDLQLNEDLRPHHHLIDSSTRLIVEGDHRHRPSCLATSSSSETQMGSSVSSSKKRVKISDPLGRRPKGRGKELPPNQQHFIPQDLNTNEQQQQQQVHRFRDDPSPINLFTCPVHMPNSNGHQMTAPGRVGDLTSSIVGSNYFLDEPTAAFLTTEGFHLWTNDDLEESAEQVNGQCDHPMNPSLNTISSNSPNTLLMPQLYHGLAGGSISSGSLASRNEPSQNKSLTWTGERVGSRTNSSLDKER